MTTSKTNLRKAVSQNTGDHQSLTATADGNSAKTSWVCSNLRNLPGGTDPDRFQEWHVLATGSGSNSGENRSVASYTPQSSGGALLLLESAHTDATSKDDTFELHRIDPDLKHIAIDRALVELYPTLYVPLRNETLIVDSILLNGDFEDFDSSTPDNWTAVNSPTLTKETSTVFHGTNSLKMVGPSGSVGRVYQDLAVNIDDAAGKILLFKMRAHTNAASQARLILDYGSSTEEGEYHDGDSDWQLLTVDSAIPTDATRVRVICEVSADDTAYFDTGWAAVDPVYRYSVINAMVRGPMHVTQQYDENFVDGPYYPLLPGESPTRGRILRLRGMGVLSTPSTESGTTEIAEPRLRLVADYACLMLVEMLGERSASQQITNLERRMDRWEKSVARLSRQPGIRMAPMGASSGENAWHIESDDGGKYLIFDSPRGFRTQ